MFPCLARSWSIVVPIQTWRNCQPVRVWKCTMQFDVTEIHLKCRCKCFVYRGCALSYQVSLHAHYVNNQKQIIQIQRNTLTIPADRKQICRVSSRMAVKLNSGLPPIHGTTQLSMRSITKRIRDGKIRMIQMIECVGRDAKWRAVPSDVELLQVARYACNRERAWSKMAAASQTVNLHYRAQHTHIFRARFTVIWF